MRFCSHRLPRQRQHLEKGFAATAAKLFRFGEPRERGGRKRGAISRERAGQQRLNVHEWLYDMESGDILAFDAETGDWRSLHETAPDT